MNRDESKTCLGCGSPLPEPFLDLGQTPLANAYMPARMAHLPEPRFPLAAAFCPMCYLVQINHRVPPEEMFSQYLYFTSFSDSLLAHARKMASELCGRLALGRGSRVLEIASNDGYLLQYFQQKGVTVLGVEPAKNIAVHAAEKGIPTLNSFFGPELVGPIRRDYGMADLVVGNNVLAHVPQINDFLRAVKDCLTRAGTAVFEFPYLKELLEKSEFDTIYHEHVFYYSLSSVKKLAERAGLHLFDVARQAVHGGSLRIFLATEPRPVGENVTRMLEEEEADGLTRSARYASFSRTVAALKTDLLALLTGLKAQGKRLAAYGAPAKGNTLLNYCGIDGRLLKFTVDRSTHKQGLLLPGSRIPIRDPACLLEEMPDYTLILPWNLAAEIVSQQAEYVRRGGRFILPVPQPRVVEAGELGAVA